VVGTFPLLTWEVAMFEVDQFVADCRAAFAEDQTHKAVREILARAVSTPAAVLKGLGESFGTALPESKSFLRCSLS